uniref:Reverse transcriptase n=1 Tax=Cannabis sativa TaxID=3483 RepID=A0A803Q0T2_CANSA
MGDFNDILAKDKRIGQRVKTHPNTEFLQCVNECQVEDVKASGSFYTWSNKQYGDDRIYSKIDRIMANQSWINTYEFAEAVFLNEGIFDHTPGLLTLYPNVISGKKPFKYFKMWKTHPSYESDLKEIWRQSGNGSKMFQTSVTRAKIDLDSIQNQLQKSPLDSNLHMLEKEARGKMIKVQGDYNSFLKQKSKVDWIQQGDCNSALFHACIRQRLRQNRILSIERLDGRRVHEPEMITEAFLEYYKGLLGTKLKQRRKVDVGISARGPILSNEQSTDLMKDFTREEVKKAAFSIPGNKSPGPDGFSSSFFQDNWELIGEDISDAVIAFLESGNILKEINSTIITLVPKCKCPNSVKDFRPIACCNVIYKIATKLLSSRISNILPEIISHSQGGSIKGRFIGHNIMICQDLVRHYHRKANKPSCMIKLDLQKAYDTVEWEFLEEVLTGLHFPNDVLLFSHGDFKSVLYMLQTLKLFSLTFGLHPNAFKTAIYCSNMQEECVNKIRQLSGFMRHDLPFTYLGVPICAKKISRKESETLAYWSQIIIMPKRVLKSIEAICRAFLWKGQAVFYGSGAVAWDNVCESKATGGLGITKLESWNKGAMSKYIWAIANNQESLWLRWVNSVYIKGQSWWSYSASVHSNWYWKRLVALKNQILSLHDSAEFQRHKYVIKAGYKMFNTPKPNTHWSKEVWSRMNTPKHSIILWLVMLNRLKTKERLIKMGIMVQEKCSLYEEQAENIQHLFFSCRETGHCLKEIKEWLGWNARASNVQQLVKWIGRAKISKFKRAVYCVATAAMVYCAWKLRNSVIWQGAKIDANRLVEEVKWNVKARVQFLFPKKLSSVDKECDSIKINVDAALFERNRSYGFGLVARDSNGLLLEGCTTLVYGVVEPVLAEVLGIKEALSWVKEAKWQNVILESDCLCAVQAIRSSLDMISTFGLIVKDCKNLLASLINVSISFVKRSANLVAHSFGKAAILFPDRRFSLEHVLTDLLPCLVAEVYG